jgi:hypothetical protein
MSIEFNVVAVRTDGFNFIEGFPDQLRAVLAAQLDAFGADMALRASDNAPILSGDLRASIRHRLTERNDVFIMDLLADESYALRMHEQLTPFGTSSPLLNRGPKSRVQPHTPEGGVGGKFLTRVVDFHLDDFITSLVEVVEQNARRAGLRFGGRSGIVVTRFTI